MHDISFPLGGPKIGYSSLEFYQDSYYRSISLQNGREATVKELKDRRDK